MRCPDDCKFKRRTFYKHRQHEYANCGKTVPQKPKAQSDRNGIRPCYEPKQEPIPEKSLFEEAKQ